ncbi:MAG: gephyrin-like molybdotransferase Glp [Thermodesulfobacteriota bacterium]
MIEFTAAQQLVLKEISILGHESVHIMDCLGRVLAEDVRAFADLPAADNSAMDGFAVRADDLSKASSETPVRLKVVGEIRAGYPLDTEVKPGQAIRIMTGGLIPKGANAVIRDEDTELVGDVVLCTAPVAERSHIRFAGENAKTGQIMIRAGEQLAPPEIGLLAALGQPQVSVYRKATVAILSTGDELVELGEPLSKGKVICSNSYSLAAQVLQCGATPLRLGIARDKAQDIVTLLSKAADADVIVSSGGVSVGKHDLVRRVLEKARLEIGFWKVAMKPGKPLLFGKLGTKPVFGLPGNPGAATIAFEQFVRPALLKMMGHQKIFRPLVEARLHGSTANFTDMVHFLRCKLHNESGRSIAELLPKQGPAILRTEIGTDGLVVLPPHSGVVGRGEAVMVQILS